MKRPDFLTRPLDHTITPRTSHDVCRDFVAIQRCTPAPMPWHERALIVCAVLAVVAVVLWGQP